MTYKKALIMAMLAILYLLSIISTIYILLVIVKGNFLYFYMDIVICFFAMIVSQCLATQILTRKLSIKKPNQVIKASLIMAFMQYCLLLFGMLLRNLSRLDYAEMANNPNFNLQLFSTIGNLLNMGRWVNIVENIGVFTLFGFFLLLAFPVCKKAVVYFAICIAFAIVIEVLQYVFRVGIFDVDDLILYSIGSCFGWLMLRIGIWMKQALLDPSKCVKNTNKS